MRWQLLTLDGKMVAREEVRFGTTFADTEPFSQVIVHAASLLAQRLARFVVQTYRLQKISDTFSDGSKVGGLLR